MSKVKLDTGISGNEQESSFMNATLQNRGPVAFSIATYVTIPPSVAEQDEAAVADYLRRTLEGAAGHVEGLTFEVQVGPEREADEGDNENEG